MGMVDGEGEPKLTTELAHNSKISIALVLIALQVSQHEPKTFILSISDRHIHSH